jgi:hypothetical protein
MTRHMSQNSGTCTNFLKMFTDIVSGERRQTASEMDGLLDHLIVCVFCQAALGTYAVLQAEADRSNRDVREAIEAFRSSLAETLHGIDFQNDLSAYIDVLETRGQTEADEQFPLVVAHLQWCNACNAIVQEARLLLHELEAGLIIPPHLDLEG